MAQLLTLSRAAQLIGVTRGDLQKKIRDGDLAAYDGLVDGADLQRVYPDLRLEETGAFERVTQIKEQAFSRRMRERLLPSQEVLAQRLFAQGQELDSLPRAGRRVGGWVLRVHRGSPRGCHWCQSPTKKAGRR